MVMMFMYLVDFGGGNKRAGAGNGWVIEKICLERYIVSFVIKFVKLRNAIPRWNETDRRRDIESHSTELTLTPVGGSQALVRGVKRLCRSTFNFNFLNK
jgi:hypothetical protein